MLALMNLTFEMSELGLILCLFVCVCVCGIMHEIEFNQSSIFSWCHAVLVIKKLLCRDSVSFFGER